MNPASKHPNARNSLGQTRLPCIALLALALLCGLAFLPSTSPLSDRITLLAIGCGLGLFSWTRLYKHIALTPERAAFVLCAGMFVVYGLARSAGPETGFSLRFAALPDDEFIIPYSSYVVVISALLCAPCWWLHKNNWTRTLLSTSVLLGFFTIFAFWLLQRHFLVGPLETLDPTPLPRMAMNLLEYSCLALLCQTVATNTITRKIALRTLPGVLLLLWAKHQFLVAPEDSE